MSFTKKQLQEAYHQMRQERQAEYNVAWEDARELEKLAGLPVIPQCPGGPCTMSSPYKQSFYFEVQIANYGPDGSDWLKAQQKDADDNLEKNIAEEDRNVKIAQSEVGPNECLKRHNWKTWQREMFDRTKSMWFYWMSSNKIEYRVLTKQVDDGVW